MLVIQQKLILKFYLKKNWSFDPKNIFQKNTLSEESVKLCFLVTFNIIRSYIFLKKFVEIHPVFQKIWIVTFSILIIFIKFLDFFTFTCYKKLMASASIR